MRNVPELQSCRCRQGGNGLALIGGVDVAAGEAAVPVPRSSLCRRDVRGKLYCAPLFMAKILKQREEKLPLPDAPNVDDHKSSQTGVGRRPVIGINIGIIARTHKSTHTIFIQVQVSSHRSSPMSYLVD
jgi:hypothetical protein